MSLTASGGIALEMNDCKELGKSLYDLRKQNQLCDVTIHVGRTSFHAHKIILAARSCYFQAMFTSGFRESTESEIRIEGVADIFEKLLEYAYTGELVITFETARDLLEMSIYMQFTNAQKSCCKFIEEACGSSKWKISSVDDVVSIHHLAKYLDLPDIVIASEEYMYSHLCALKTSQVFFETADVEYLEKLLKREDFSSKYEEKEVFEMIINWLHYDWESRYQHASLLLGLTRLGQVPERRLLALLDEEILEIPECKLLLQQTQEALRSRCSELELVKQLPNLFATRSTVTAPICISTGYASCSDTSDSKVSFYNKSWARLHIYASLPYIPSLIVVDEQIYAAGGLQVTSWYDDDDIGPSTETKCVNKFLVYDAEINLWKTLAPMKNYRHSFLLVHLNGFIYAIGGFCCDGELLNCMERFYVKDIDMSWQRCAPLPEDYQWVSAVPYQGMILAYGMKGSVHVITMYNPDKNIWHTKLNETHTQRSMGYFHSEEHDKDPVLFLHKDVLYRILYQEITGDATMHLSSWELGMLRQPLVNKLQVQTKKICFCNCPNHPKKNAFNVSNEDHPKEIALKVSIGEEVKQDLIPPNEVGAFRIEDEVFVSLKGFAHQTDLTIQEDQSTDVVLGKWKHFQFDSDELHSNAAYLTIDVKKLGYL